MISGPLKSDGCSAPLVLALSLAAGFSIGASQPLPRLHPIRFDSNPLITPASSASIGDNINGPSVIRVPKWVQNPRGKFYLFFAHHMGQFIRMAYADSLPGPWKVFEPGVFRLSQLQASEFTGHIASPDVHVDEANHRILMYFHGGTGSGQKTGLAVSATGLEFAPWPGTRLAPNPDILGDFYFRVFSHGGQYYAFAKNGNVGGELLHSRDGVTPFEKGPDLVPKMRHTAVLVRGDSAYLFYTRAGDAPERLLFSTFSVAGDWRTWAPSEPVEILRPEKTYEGANLPVVPSDWGEVPDPANQLRDPAIFEDNGKVYLFYSIAGEQGIAAAELPDLALSTTAIKLSPRHTPSSWNPFPPGLDRDWAGRFRPFPAALREAH